MSKYLWELDLTKIPFAWEEECKKASLTAPKGSYIDLKDGDSPHWYDPIGYKNLIFNEFNKLQTQAISLISNKNTMDLHTFSNKLLKLDICLYNLLSAWCDTSRCYDYRDYDYREYIDNKEYLDFHTYFETLQPVSIFDKKYSKYKFFTLY